MTSLLFLDLVLGRRDARGFCYAVDVRGGQMGLAPGLIRLFDGIGPVGWGMRRASMQGV